MALVLDVLMAVLKKQTIEEMVSELAFLAALLWIALLVGLLVGWAWRPRWVGNFVGEKGSSGGLLKTASDSLVAGESSGNEENGVDLMKSKVPELAVTSEDLDHLCKLVEMTDGGPSWHQMMDKSLPTMSYQAWRREPETGPPQYRSRTVYEDMTPEIVRDFFWDDEFRLKNKWDDMLLHHSTLEECPTTGTMVVHWVRKFPFFCSDREYIIGRRIWESERTYYCVTKGVPYPSVPRRDKPKRVDLYYSSWCIRPVESRRGDGQLTACEVILFHHEDMGIPRELAKLGVRQGMWGLVKKIEPGLRAYQIERQSGTPLSRCAFLAQINTKINSDYLRSLDTSNNVSDIVEAEDEKRQKNSIPRFLIIGGAVALACTLDRGLLTKAIIFGVARRLGR
ncbi:START domain-containing proteins involved in steroidogenesis/phosphatidylcholine transfer protein [Dioscorea alata]|uniref:START domain-containing proteins involved in steroidogenesis/phosphatidylcholine transfer protein n=1 Tax=Dioscorea alata TaxID=55571 RepID=A0ACB7WGF5_DIOAL|nr:START domain-containing proteins involved in steroidogenesis/phosphatidylcholine transfer protein [Dioscorea alata]